MKFSLQAGAGAADADALVGLDAALVAFHHLDVDQHGVARREVGNVLAGREFLDLLFIDLLDDVHGLILRRQRQQPARGLVWSEWVGRASTTKLAALSPSGFGPVLGLFTGQIGRPEVRAALPGEPFGLGAAPVRDLAVVARQSARPGSARPSKTGGRVYCGYSSSPSAKLSSAIEASLPMTPGSSRTQASSSAIAAGLPAGEHEIAERNFLELARLDQPLIDALEAAADDHDAEPGGQHCRPSLRQRCAARAHQQARAMVVRNGVERARQHVRLHHHAGPAAGRRVVHGAVFVGGGVADVVGVERPDARGQAPCRRG